MKKILFFIILYFGISLISCSNDNGVNPVDTDLQKNIIGTWQDNSRYTITYFSDGKFIDTLLYFDQSIDTSIIIRNGKYDISNSVLTYSEFQYDTIISQSSFGFATIEYSYEITIQNSVLKRKPFTVFNNIGQNRVDIWDKWQTDRWFAQIDANNWVDTYYGSYRMQYEFKPDSNKCIQTNKFHNAINDSVYEYNYILDYSYNSPYLTISPYQNILVKFINNKMYWYYNYVPNDLLKIR